MPLSVPVPLPLSAKVTPPGSAPASVSAGVGKPVVVTVNDPAEPAVNIVLLALVIAGGWFTWRVKSCTVEPAALVAVKVR